MIPVTPNNESILCRRTRRTASSRKRVKARKNLCEENFRETPLEVGKAGERTREHHFACRSKLYEIMHETEATSRATTNPPNGYRYPPSREDQEASDRVAKREKTRRSQETKPTFQTQQHLGGHGCALDRRQMPEGTSPTDTPAAPPRGKKL